MRAPAGSLLEQTSRLIVRRQIAYGSSARPALGDFGIGLQRPRPGVHLPIFEFRRARPRAEARPGRECRRRAVCDGARGHGRSASGGAQLRAARRLGARGRYGFYEALDYTPSRLPEGQTVAIVRAFMAHHQGMTIVAIADALLDGAMRDAVPCRTDDPGDRTAAAGAHAARRAGGASLGSGREGGRQGAARSDLPGGRRLDHRAHCGARTHLLSNGRYAVMLTAAGSGYSRWRGLAVTRWREDATCDDWGSYIFLRDVRSGEVWSAGLPAERRRARRL